MEKWNPWCAEKYIMVATHLTTGCQSTTSYCRGYRKLSVADGPGALSYFWASYVRAFFDRVLERDHKRIVGKLNDEGELDEAVTLQQSTNLDIFVTPRSLGTGSEKYASS